MLGGGVAEWRHSVYLLRTSGGIGAECEEIGISGAQNLRRQVRILSGEEQEQEQEQMETSY